MSLSNRLKAFLLRFLTYKKITLFNIKHAKRVLFFRYDRIGDMVISTAVFRELKVAYPELKISVLASKVNKGVLSNNPYVDEIIINNKNNIFIDLFSLVKLRKQRIDVCVEFDHSVVPHAILRLKIINPKKIISVYKNGRYGVAGNELLLYDFFTEKPKNTHSRDVWLNTLEPFDIKPKSSTYDLFVNKKQDMFAKNFLKNLSSYFFVGINLEGAIKGKKIQYNELEKICKALGKKNVVIIIISQPKKLKATSKLIEKMNIKYVFPSYKTSSILDLAALIKNLDLIITPDTSISHIASAFNKPIITIHENNNDSYELFSPTSMLNKTFFSQEKNNLRGYDIQALIDHTSHLINKISKNENSRH